MASNGYRKRIIPKIKSDQFIIHFLDVRNNNKEPFVIK